MTYTMYGSGSSIGMERCTEKTKAGERCKRRVWITSYEAPNGYQCPQHGGSKEMRR